MATPYRLKAIEEEHGKSLDVLIPELLNELGTMDAVARRLNTTSKTIYTWCKGNGVEKKVVWVKVSQMEWNND